MQTTRTARKFIKGLLMKVVIEKVAEKLIELIPALLLALAGGFAKTWAGKPRDARYDWKIALPEIIIAGFCGIVMHYLCIYFKTPEALAAVIIAISGYGARGILEVMGVALVQKIKHVSNININERRKK